MSDELTTPDVPKQTPKQTMEQWAAERGHVDPVPTPGQRLAITDFKRFIYECARVRAGFAYGKEMTGDEYDRAVHRAMHETLAR